MRLARASVRWKFVGVVLVTTAIALLVAGGALLTHDVKDYRRAWIADLETEADVLALSTEPALAFDDRPTAARNVGSLQAQPAVLAAGIYMPSGAPFALYARPGAHVTAPARLAKLVASPVIGAGRVEVTRRVEHNGEWLGTVYLLGRYDVVGRIETYLEILGLVILMSMVIALALSTALQRVITRPLDAMAAVARSVVAHRD